MFSTPSQDMTAAWYAAAPPPPPPAPAKDGRTSNVRGYGTVRSSSSSTSLSFDKRALGDDLPFDSYAPEPERPVSRNAMARQRERERQRARSNSNLGHDYAMASHQMAGPHSPANVHAAQSLRHRRESSPIVPVTYEQQGAYHYDQTHVQAVPSYTHGYSQAPSPVSAQQMWPSYAVPVATVHEPQRQQEYASAFSSPQHHAASPQSQYNPQAYVSGPQPTQAYLQHTAWQNTVPHTAEAQQMMYAPPVQVGGYTMPPQSPAQWTNAAMQPPHVLDPASYAEYQMAGVPFPTKPVSALPEQAVHGYAPAIYSTPPSTVNSSFRRPLPSTCSRTSSQSSSVGTRASTASLGSMSGTVRRSLPQPPTPRSDSNAAGATPPMPTSAHYTASSASHATVRPTDVLPAASLGRHESVRVAAEELMARGPPRRRAGIPTGMMASGRTTTHGNASRSDGSITDGCSSSASKRPFTNSTPPTTSRARAESSGCLEKEMQAMRIGKHDETTPPDLILQKRASVPVPSQDSPIRTASPRPIRAAPRPAPEVTTGIAIDDVIPRRPLSRGPKDEQERKRSMDATAAALVAIGIPRTIHSPPPDQKPPVPIIAFGESDVAPVHGVPQIVLPSGSFADHSGDQTIVPTTQKTEYEQDRRQATPAISISVSSASIAQHSTTSSTGQVGQPSQASASTAALPARSRYLAPEPASAPSVGSGAACATCQKWISGKVVHAMSHAFHPDCFVCFHCNEHLEHVAFYEHEGRPYCHFDFHELFSKRCFHCRTPIVDQRYITINDPELTGGESQERCYHDTHFFCANCGDPFLDPKVAASAAGAEADQLLAHVIETEEGDEGGGVKAVVTYGGREFVVHKGYPYCGPCHVSQHKPRCKGCKRPIVEEDVLTALRAKWHVGCFCCERCTKPIDSDNFFVRDNCAYDEECYKIKLRSEL